MILKIKKTTSGKIHHIKFEVNKDVYLLNILSSDKDEWSLSVLPHKPKKQIGIKYSSNKGNKYVIFYANDQIQHLSGFALTQPDKISARLTYGNLAFADWDAINEDLKTVRAEYKFKIPTLPVSQ